MGLHLDVLQTLPAMLKSISAAFVEVITCRILSMPTFTGTRAEYYTEKWAVLLI